MMHCSGQNQREPLLHGRHVMGLADHVSAERREERRLSHYSSEHVMLLVGEGDFSFSASLANAFGTAYNIVATSLDSTDDLHQKYGASAFNNLSNLQYRGAQVYHGVNACSMASQNFNYEFGGRLRLFDRIIYNFPHAGFSGREDDDLMIWKHKELVLNFFRNAVHMLLHGGEVHVTHKYGDPYDKWRLVEQAESCGLALQSSTCFYLSDFPGYCNRRGAGSKAGETFEPCKSATFIFVARELGKKKQTLNVLLKESARGSLRTLQQPGNKHAESSMKAEESSEDDQSRPLIWKMKSEKLNEKSRQKLPVPIEASAPRRTKGVASAYAEGRNVKNRGQLTKNEKLEEELVKEVGMECETSFSVNIFDHSKNCYSTFTDPYAAVEVMKKIIVSMGLASSGTWPVQVVCEEIVRLSNDQKYRGLGKKKQNFLNVMELILKELVTRSLRTLHQLGNEHGDQSSLKVEESFKNREQVTGKEQLKPEELVQMVGMECETSFSVTIFDHTKNCVSTFTDPYAAVEVMKEGIVRKGLASSGTWPVQVVSNEIVRLTKHRKHGGLSKKKQTSVNVMELILKGLARRSLRTLLQLGNELVESSVKVEEALKNREELTGNELLNEELVQQVGMECETSFCVTIFDDAKNCVSAFTDPYAAVDVIKESIVRKGLASSDTWPVQVVSEEIVRLTKHRKLSKKKQTLLNVMELILKELATRSLRTFLQLGNDHAESTLKVEETVADDQSCTLLCKVKIEQPKEKSVQKLPVPIENSLTPAPRRTKGVANPYVEGTSCGSLEEREELSRREQLKELLFQDVSVPVETSQLLDPRHTKGVAKSFAEGTSCGNFKKTEQLTQREPLKGMLVQEGLFSMEGSQPPDPRHTKGVAKSYAEGTSCDNRYQWTKKEQLKEKLIPEVGMECEPVSEVNIFDSCKKVLLRIHRFMCLC